MRCRRWTPHHFGQATTDCKQQGACQEKPVAAATEVSTTRRSVLRHVLCHPLAKVLDHLPATAAFTSSPKHCSPFLSLRLLGVVLSCGQSHNCASAGPLLPIGLRQMGERAGKEGHVRSLQRGCLLGCASCEGMCMKHNSRSDFQGSWHMRYHAADDAKGVLWMSYLCVLWLQIEMPLRMTSFVER